MIFSTDRTLSRLVCFPILEQLYTARQRAYHVTCSQLLGDWARGQRSAPDRGRGLTVGVLLAASQLASQLNYMMEMKSFSEQILIVTTEDWVPNVAVENCHWFQARLHKVRPVAQPGGGAQGAHALPIAVGGPIGPACH